MLAGSTSRSLKPISRTGQAKRPISSSARNHGADLGVMGIGRISWGLRMARSIVIRKDIQIIPLLLAAVFFLSVCADRGPHETHPSGDYFGQRSPGDSSVVFAPGLISTGYDELNSVFSADGNEFYYSIKRPNQDRHILLVMKRINDSWTTPSVLPFSGLFGDADPAFAQHGDRLYFVSRRPVASDADSSDWNIWYADRTRDTWTEARSLGPPVNTRSHEIHPSFAGDGTMYFSSNREGGLGGFDIYRSRLKEGEYTVPENLGEPINTEYGEGDLFIAPDESYIIFSSGRPGGLGRNDLYISFMQSDGSWTVPINMGDEVNSEEIEYSPFVTRDGKYLFYSSYRRISDVAEAQIDSREDISRVYSSPGNGLGDIYWIEAQIIDDLRSGAPGE